MNNQAKDLNWKKMWRLSQTRKAKSAKRELENAGKKESSF